MQVNVMIFLGRVFHPFVPDGATVLDACAEIDRQDGRAEAASGARQYKVHVNNKLFSNVENYDGDIYAGCISNTPLNDGDYVVISTNVAGNAAIEPISVFINGEEYGLPKDVTLEQAINILFKRDKTEVSDATVDGEPADPESVLKGDERVVISFKDGIAPTWVAPTVRTMPAGRYQRPVAQTEEPESVADDDDDEDENEDETFNLTFNSKRCEAGEGESLMDFIDNQISEYVNSSYRVTVNGVEISSNDWYDHLVRPGDVITYKDADDDDDDDDDEDEINVTFNDNDCTIKKDATIEDLIKQENNIEYTDDDYIVTVNDTKVGSNDWADYELSEGDVVTYNEPFVVTVNDDEYNSKKEAIIAILDLDGQGEDDYAVYLDQVRDLLT